VAKKNNSWGSSTKSYNSAMKSARGYESRANRTIKNSERYVNNVQRNTNRQMNVGNHRFQTPWLRERDEVTNTTIINEVEDNEEFDDDDESDGYRDYYQMEPHRAVRAHKSRIIAIGLCFFLGVIGAHKYYEGRYLFGLLYLGLYLWPVTRYIVAVFCIFDILYYIFKRDPWNS